MAVDDTPAAQRPVRLNDRYQPTASRGDHSGEVQEDGDDGRGASHRFGQPFTPAAGYGTNYGTKVLQKDTSNATMGEYQCRFNTFRVEHKDALRRFTKQQVPDVGIWFKRSPMTP